jgi:negative regulator of genetic competence, sporulation and motility
MKSQESKFLEVLLELSDYDDGINADGYARLMEFARDTMPGVCSDIEKT